MTVGTRARRWLSLAAGAGTLWLCLFLGTGPVAAEAEPPPLRAAKAKLRAELHELASWCTSRKLFGSRHDLYELVIELWPDDEVARKWNGYARDGGGWRASKKKRPRNLTARALPVLRDRQKKVADGYLREVKLALRGQPEGEAAAWRGQAIRYAATIAPDDESIRALNGEVPGQVKGRKGKWILVETARSRERRPALRKAAKEALASVPKPQKAEPLPADLHSSVRWVHVFQGPHARILGVSTTDEVDRGLLHGEACFPFFEAAFGTPPPDVPGFTFYVFDTEAGGNDYMAGQPGVSPSYMKYAAPLVTVWIPNSKRVVIKTPELPLRLESPARQAFAEFTDRVFGITDRQGWAAEGFGLHLTWHITGTRLLYSVTPTRYGGRNEVRDLSERLREQDADWVAEARTVLASSDAPDLRLVLGKSVNTLTPEDLLFGYVLSVFLLEGHAQALPALLRDVAGVKDANYDAVFGQHLGMDVATLEHRVRRWLEETRGLK